mgnify:CR=1 FL=1
MLLKEKIEYEGIIYIKKQFRFFSEKQMWFKILNDPLIYEFLLNCYEAFIKHTGKFIKISILNKAIYKYKI